MGAQIKVLETQTPFSLFFELVERACLRHRISEPLIGEYLAQLLHRFVRREQGEILYAPILFTFRDRVSRGAAVSEIREVGDAALWVASMLRPSKSKKPLSTESYVEVAKSAYRIVMLRSSGENAARSVYQRLSENLWPYVGVLTEVRQESIFTTSLDDIIEVWTRYKASGKEEDARWLAAHGIMLLSKPPEEDKKKILM